MIEPDNRDNSFNKLIQTSLSKTVFASQKKKKRNNVEMLES